MTDSTKGGWLCPGKEMPPLQRRTLTRSDVAALARTEAYLNRLFDHEADADAWPWRTKLAEIDASLAITHAAA
jgi:hypothetical protein